MPNAYLLRRTLAHIEAEPHSWNQFVWARRTDCGTAMCFAGWAVTLAGAQVDFRRFGDELSTNVITPESRSELGLRTLYIDEAAQELLDLSLEEAEELFAGANSIKRLRALVAELAVGECDA